MTIPSPPTSGGATDDLEERHERRGDGGGHAMNWQPIETAPKARRILLSDGMLWIAGYYSSIRECWACDGGERIEPTHWMEIVPPEGK